MKDKETVDHSSKIQYPLLTYQYLVLPKDPNLQHLLAWQPAAPEQLNLQLNLQPSRNLKQISKGHVDNAEEQHVPSASPVHGAP